MKFTPLIITLFLFTARSSGQTYGNIWQFGENVGLDFNGCSPQIIVGSNTGFEGCSTYSDNSGQLLFYTNSDKVWNRLNEEMPNGNLNTTSGTISQVIIIPKPSSNSIYYIITTKIQAGGSLSLQYHTVDMTMEDGLGDVVESNSVLSELNVTEQVCATYHENGSDIWIMTHEYGTNKFLAYLATPSGISTDPVISEAGVAHAPCNSNINARGEIKFSPNGRKIAFNANGIGGADSTNILMLCNFNNFSGQVSNAINLPYSRGEFGLSFSPDNSKLYGATWKAFAFGSVDKNYLYQFDLSTENAISIINSKVILDSLSGNQSFGSIKIGPDAKVYIRIRNFPYLGVINSPNEAGISCDYARDGLLTNNLQNQYGLNNYIEYESYCTTTDISDSGAIQEIITLYPNPTTTEVTLESSRALMDVSLMVYNSCGQLIQQLNRVTGSKMIVSFNDPPSGIYFIQVIRNHEIIKTEKLIVN